MVLFLNALAQASPKNDWNKGNMITSDLEIKGSHSMYLKGKVTERETVWCLLLTVTCLQVNWPQRRPLCYLYTANLPESVHAVVAIYGSHLFCIMSDKR